MCSLIQRPFFFTKTYSPPSLQSVLDKQELTSSDYVFIFKKMQKAVVYISPMGCRYIIIPTESRRYYFTDLSKKLAEISRKYFTREEPIEGKRKITPKDRLCLIAVSDIMRDLSYQTFDQSRRYTLWFYSMGIGAAVFFSFYKFVSYMRVYGTIFDYDYRWRLHTFNYFGVFTENQYREAFGEELTQEKRKELFFDCEKVLRRFVEKHKHIKI